MLLFVPPFSFDPAPARADHGAVEYIGGIIDAAVKGIAFRRQPCQDPAAQLEYLQGVEVSEIDGLHLFRFDSFAARWILDTRSVHFQAMREGPDVLVEVGELNGL